MTDFIGRKLYKCLKSLKRMSKRGRRQALKSSKVKSRELNPWTYVLLGALAILAVWLFSSTITGSITQTKCTDSDGGINYFERGTLKIEGKTVKDYCRTSTTVYEYYCNGTKIASTTYKCPLGCASGACKMTPTNTSTSTKVPTTNSTNSTK